MTKPTASPPEPTPRSPAMRAHVADHRPEAVRRRLDLGTRHSYLKDFVYGAIDGAVTTFAVVSGVAGAGLDPAIVIILGFANLVGDGFSMAASNFLATRAEEQLRAKARRAEERHIADYAEGEREEVRQIFAAKGFVGDDLELVVDVITSDREQWVDTMLQEELGLPLESPSATKAALTTFFAFVAVGLLPLLPFLAVYFVPGLAWRPFVASSLVTGLAFFAVGAAKGKFVDEHWLWSGLETAAVGGAAASLAYAIGLALKGIVS
ncbi:MAG: VIT1/CCC1 transporter family protein [Planctomycetota bacterium]